MNPQDQHLSPKQSAGANSGAPSARAPPQSPVPGPPMPALPPFMHKLDANKGWLPSTERCHTHLKLLNAFNKLYSQISSSNGLFGYTDNDSVHGKGKDDTSPTGEKIKSREKRWGVYVARAVSRFTAWWLSLPRTGNGVPAGVLSVGNYRERVVAAQMYGGLDGGLVISVDTMPPLDVIMVWHAYMLNPRCFLEDCFRLGLMDFWMTGLPWALIDSLIDEDFNYNLSLSAIHHFREKTGLPGDNLSMADTETIVCPSCNELTTVPWTNVQDNTGFADSGFLKTCVTEGCHTSITVDTLSRSKFLSAVRDYVDEQKRHLLPGTILDEEGKVDVSTFDQKRSSTMFPNHLCAHLLWDFSAISASPTAGMGDIKSIIESRREDPSVFNSTDKGRLFAGIFGNISLRRMMSRFWNNPGPFALDLTGAVIRQGSFAEKMSGSDWYQSPSVAATLERAVGRYVRFWGVIIKYPAGCVVPTLDVDLVWHTHMLAPGEYWKWSVGATRRYIAHDDKVEEAMVGDGFRWTSKEWRKLYKEDYTGCNCWFCETALPKPGQSTSILKRFFGSKKTPPAPTPVSAPTEHLSAHSAVKVPGNFALNHRTNFYKIAIASYDRACKKKGTRSGDKEAPRADVPSGSGEANVEEPFRNVFPSRCEKGNFAVNPRCFTIQPGEVGHCVSGTCGGGAAAGRCTVLGSEFIGGAGACVGGSAGGKSGYGTAGDDGVGEEGLGAAIEVAVFFM